MLAFFLGTRYNAKCVSGCGSAWLERRLREAEVASSNPATPMRKRCRGLDSTGLPAFLFYGNYIISFIVKYCLGVDAKADE